MSLTNTFEEKKEEFNKELDQLFPNSDLTITYTRKTNEVDIYGTMHPMDLYYMMLFNESWINKKLRPFIRADWRTYRMNPSYAKVTGPMKFASSDNTVDQMAPCLDIREFDPDEIKPLRRKNPTGAFMSGFYCIIMALKQYYYNILISNDMDFMDILVNLNRRVRELSSTGEKAEAEKTAPKYTCIITSEADLPDKQLDYFSDNPWDGNLEEVIMFNTIGELFQHDVEGLFYQLYENEHGTRLGYGMVDPDYPAADIQDFEKKSEKKEQKLEPCLIRGKNTFHVGDKVIHFKWELNSEHTDNYIYEITGFPKNTETEEQYVAYRSVADPSKEWVRPIMEFLSEVDHQKYPEIKQKYRFVKY